jgi:AraC-like DNA-binding protein
MLRYVGTGPRDYHQKCVLPYARPFWEFQAALSGAIAMTGTQSAEVFRSNYLWLTPPGHFHGWTGKVGRPAEVAVFHFPTIPEQLKRSLPPRGILGITLQPDEAILIRTMAKKIDAEWRNPSPLMLLRAEYLLLHLTFLICESFQGAAGERGENEVSTVKKALDYFSNNLERNPSIDEVSRACGTSPSQLRRFFRTIMQASPKEVFNSIRFQRAVQLMAAPDCKLGAVASECGFEDQSSFSRAFRKRFGYSPSKIN